MAIVRAIRPERFIQYDGSNGQEIADAISQILPYLTYDVSDGVLILHTEDFRGDIAVSESDWISLGSGAAIPDSEFSSNYVKLSDLGGS